MGARNSKPRGKSEDPLAYLKLFNTVLIVDDSGSMAGRKWSTAERALARIAEVASKYDSDGIEIQFLNSRRRISGVKDAATVMDFFKTVDPRGFTPLGQKLDDLLTDYIKRLDQEKDLKPVNYIVITDGKPTDQGELSPEPVIVRAAKALDSRHAKMSQVGIQFVQIGNDDVVRAYLESLDDNLKNKYEVRDIVDTTPAQIGERLDLVKVMMGAIHRRVDIQGSSAFKV